MLYTRAVGREAGATGKLRHACHAKHRKYKSPKFNAVPKGSMGLACVLKSQQVQVPDRQRFDPNNLEAISTTAA